MSLLFIATAMLFHFDDFIASKHVELHIENRTNEALSFKITWSSESIVSWKTTGPIATGDIAAVALGDKSDATLLGIEWEFAKRKVIYDTPIQISLMDHSRAVVTSDGCTIGQ